MESTGSRDGDLTESGWRTISMLFGMEMVIGVGVDISVGPEI